MLSEVAEKSGCSDFGVANGDFMWRDDRCKAVEYMASVHGLCDTGMGAAAVFAAVVVVVNDDVPIVDFGRFFLALVRFGLDRMLAPGCECDFTNE